MRVCDHLVTKKMYYAKRWLLVCRDCRETQRELIKKEIPHEKTKND